jgi:histidine ammonia-lyase
MGSGPRTFKSWWCCVDGPGMDQPDRIDDSSERARAALRVVPVGGDPAQGSTEGPLRSDEEQFRTLVANIPGVVYRCACDAEWTMRFFSEHIEQLIGYPADDFIGNRRRTYGSLIHPEDRSLVVRAIESALDRGDPYSLQYRLMHADGSVRWVAEHGRAVLDEGGERLWLDGVILDVSEQKRAQEAREHAEGLLREQADLNRHQALHDSLTGLPNRRLFNDRMEQAVSSARMTGDSFALLLLDVDGFKEINDTLGHVSGDHLLQEIACRLAAQVREVDSAARLGGDEFAVLMPGSSAGSALAIAERIRAALSQPFALDELSVHVAASIGVAVFPEHGDDSIALMRAADVAMYLAKDTNAGCAVYDCETDMLAPGRLALVADLRRALETRELILHYQPKVEMRSGRVSGVEALLRWDHPQRGLIPPDEFIPIAEKTDLIKPLTLYVLDEALRQCQCWEQLGYALSVAVNVSTRNLIEADFAGVVAGLLEKWRVSPRLLELEITETAIVTDHFRCLAVLEQLSALGVRVSVDDFGTGYTSLAYLKRLPIEEVKVDRSFVTDMARSENDRVIVRSTIELCRNLGLRVVAEGVESGEVWEDLMGLGCDVAQGYLMSRALPPDELLAWVEALSESGSGRVWNTGPSHADDEEPEPRTDVSVGAGSLTIAEIVRVAEEDARVVLSPDARTRMARSRLTLEAALARGARVYGLTAGVGPQKTVAVAASDQDEFNRLMILAHCVGHGELAPARFVRAAMLVRAEGLAQGAAGTRPEIAEGLLAALNAHVAPSVHLIGSLGQSDLAPLAEIARALTGQGPDATLIEQAGLTPLTLAPGEALALISSNAFSIGIAILSLVRAQTALRALEISAALAFEGFLANVASLDPAVARLRPHRGIADTLENMRQHLRDGALLSGLVQPRNLQDPLCFRVVPQTHATARHALSHLQELLEIEISAASDNPAVICDEQRILPTGNHDGAPITAVLDYVRSALAQTMTIANERIQKLLDSRFSGLPSGLRADHVLSEDGLAVIGHGSSALTAEARLLASPVALEQPTSSLAEGIEDRITLAPVAARRLDQIAGYATRLAAIELTCAAQAVDLRGTEPALGHGTTISYQAVRRHISFTGPHQAPSGNLDLLVRWLETES